MTSSPLVGDDRDGDVALPRGSGTPRAAAPPAGPSPRALPRGLILLLGAASTVVVVAGMFAVAWLLAPILLAMVIVIAANPVARWLRARGWPTWAAAAALVLVIYIVLLAVVLTLTTSIGQLVTILPRYAAQFDALIGSAGQLMQRFGISAPTAQAATGPASLGPLLGFLGGLVSGLLGVLTNVVLILALLLFFAVDAVGFDRRLERIAAQRPHVVAALDDFTRGTRRYLVVTTVFGLIVAVLDGIALAVMGVPLVVLWGLLAFITNYIPNIGFVVGLVPPALLALLSGGPELMVTVVVVYIVINFIVQSLIQPRFVGSSVGVTATVTFLGLLFWAWIMGALGALLAMPLTLLVKALLVDTDPQAGWVEALIGSGDDEDPPDAGRSPAAAADPDPPAVPAPAAPGDPR